jgi:hypothetical protein
MSFKYESDYQSKLKSPHWQKKRLQVLNRDKWRCKLCKDEETTLHVHHLEYQPKKQPWEYAMSNFTTLCEHCHREVELLKEENHFDEILIDKIKWASGDVTLFVYAKSMKFPAMKFYDKNGRQFGGYQLTIYGQKIICSYFRNCNKLDNYIESKEVQEYLLEKSIFELENKFES